MRIDEIMVEDVVTISPFASLREALQRMRQSQVTSLVVEQQNSEDAWGMLTHSDLLRVLVSEHGDSDLITVLDACTKPVISIGPSLEVHHAATLMLSYRIRQLPVIDDNRLVGLVTMGTLVATLPGTPALD